MLQSGRSRVQFSMWLSPNRNEYVLEILRAKDNRRVKDDDLNSLETNFLENTGPGQFTTLWAFAACYRDSFFTVS
jgi:hypothetical protein